MEPTDEVDVSLIDDIYTKSKNPRAWLEQAEYLNAAGNSVIESYQNAFKKVQKEQNTDKQFVLLRSPDMWMIMTGAMLYGFALENLLKGMWVAANSNAVTLSNNKISTLWYKKRIGHKLTDLALEQGLRLTDEEIKVLSLLTKLTTWGGRYPAPKDAFEGEIGLEWSNRSAEVYSQLYARFRNAILN